MEQSLEEIYASAEEVYELHKQMRSKLGATGDCGCESCRLYRNGA